jgi:hypothetical protein
LLRFVPFSAPAALRNLRPFVFRDHALKLHQQLILRARSGRRLQEDQLHATAGKFFGEQHLIGVFAAQPVRSIDQGRSDLAFRRQVAQSFQTGPRQTAPL